MIVPYSPIAPAVKPAKAPALKVARFDWSIMNATARATAVIIKLPFKAMRPLKKRGSHCLGSQTKASGSLLYRGIILKQVHPGTFHLLPVIGPAVGIKLVDAVYRSSNMRLSILHQRFFLLSGCHRFRGDILLC
jgi:hypothetical protein